MLEDAKLLDEDYVRKQSTGTQFVLNSTPYATGLFWQQLQNPEDYLTEIKETAENVLDGADLFCVRQGKAPQFGICVEQDGYKKGDIAAAIGIASALADKTSFVAMFRVPNGWWYVCVRNDIILADGDVLFFNENDAKDKFYSMMSVPDWELRIAPKDWAIDGTEEIPVESLLNRGVQVKLDKINALRGAKLVLVLLALIIGGVWAASQAIQFVFNSLPQKPVVRPVQIKEVEKVEVPPEVKPWEEILNPTDVMYKCYEGAQDLVKILPPGWAIEGITCSPTSITTSWRREIGRVLWINKALDVSGLEFSGRSISSDGSSLMASMPIKNISTINSAPNKNTVDLINTLNDLFQSLEQGIALGTASYTSPQGNVYNSVTFSFSSNHDPVMWNDVLIKIPGLEIKSIRYDINSKIWQYEGAIYAL